MNVLYLGKYKRRFFPVAEYIGALPKGSKVLELCFGDVYLAEFCRKNGFQWKGLDINEHFVQSAKRMGYDADFADISKLDSLPKADICIMMGSLYHFYPHFTVIIERMLGAAQSVVISEPVSNLSRQRGPVGFLARRAASVGKRHETFRFDRLSLVHLLTTSISKSAFKITVIQDHGKDLIAKLLRHDKD